MACKNGTGYCLDGSKLYVADTFVEISRSANFQSGKILLNHVKV